MGAGGVNEATMRALLEALRQAVHQEVRVTILSNVARPEELAALETAWRAVADTWMEVTR
jgi:NAD(P)H-flavin reductase